MLFRVTRGATTKSFLVLFFKKERLSLFCKRIRINRIISPHIKMLARGDQRLEMVQAAHRVAAVVNHGPG
jgi:hypothetical protein